MFGVHGVGGMLGAILTGVFTARPGRHRRGGLSIASQVVTQALGVVITIVWSGVWPRSPTRSWTSSSPARAEDEEREGLDITATASPRTTSEAFRRHEEGRRGPPFFTVIAHAAIGGLCDNDVTRCG